MPAPSRRELRPRELPLHRLVLALIVVLCLPVASSLGQNMPGAAPAAGSPTAAQLAAAVDRHYNALHSLRVQFTESYAGMGIHRVESGTLLLRRPGDMRWSYTSPPGKIFVLDGKWAWFYAPGDAQVQQVPAKQLDDLRSPLRFLLGHAQLGKELNGLTAVPDGGGYRLSGVPRGLESRVSRLALTIEPSGLIDAMEIEETDGARTSFRFTGQEPGVPAPPSEFVFHPPAGVPVVKGLPPV